MTEATLSIANPDELLALFGARDQHLRKLRRLFDVSITQRNGRIRITGEGDDVERAMRTLEILRVLSRKQGELSAGDVDTAARAAGGEEKPKSDSGDNTLKINPLEADPSGAKAGQADPDGAAANGTGGPKSKDAPRSGRSGRSGAENSPKLAIAARNDEIEIQHAGRRIKPRTPGQARYVDAIRAHDLTFATGPAGCGKTYLAVATAVEALRAGQMRKIVLVRPAVEAGESLGFLPGDLRAKLNPYLRPLMDALGEMIDYDQARNLMEQDVIEVIPLAYMRGRTLSDAFIILDEAQNTTVAQMKMFLTRMGERSKMVVSGDATQQDLPRGVTSGLRDAIRRLGKIDDIGMVRLQASDIVRHRLVQKIVEAYEDVGQLESHTTDGDPKDQH